MRSGGGCHPGTCGGPPGLSSVGSDTASDSTRSFASRHLFDVHSCAATSAYTSQALGTSLPSMMLDMHAVVDRPGLSAGPRSEASRSTGRSHWNGEPDGRRRRPDRAAGRISRARRRVSDALGVRATPQFVGSRRESCGGSRIPVGDAQRMAARDQRMQLGKLPRSRGDDSAEARAPMDLTHASAAGARDEPGIHLATDDRLTPHAHRTTILATLTPRFRGIIRADSHCLLLTFGPIIHILHI
jgi:hypothetical protein